MKHTQGPWTLWRYGKKLFIQSPPQQDCNGLPMGTKAIALIDPGKTFKAEEAEANAALILSAPQMYATLAEAHTVIGETLIDWENVTGDSLKLLHEKIAAALGLRKRVLDFPKSISTVDEAKAFLKMLHDNGMDYHPEDSPETVYHTTKSGKRLPKWYAYADKSKGQEHRAAIRSKTFSGIAEAMAVQWGPLAGIPVTEYTPLSMGF